MKFIYLVKKCGFPLVMVNSLFKYVFGLNRHFPFLLHFTSRVRVPSKIIIRDVGKRDLFRCFAESPGVYVQALNGVHLHSCLNLGPGVKIISSNHDLSNLSEHVAAEPVKIGKGVWLGADVIILPGVQIGDGVTIGAGSVVTKSIPSGVVAVGNPCKVIE